MPRLSELKPGDRFWWKGEEHLKLADNGVVARLSDGQLEFVRERQGVEVRDEPSPLANVADLKPGACFLYESEHYVVLSNKKGGVLTLCLEGQWKNTFDPGIFVELVKGGLTITTVHADSEKPKAKNTGDKEVGRALREIREAKSSSCEEFAQLLGVNASLLAELESGRVRLSDDLARQCNELFGIDPFTKAVCDWKHLDGIPEALRPVVAEMLDHWRQELEGEL